MKEIRLFSEDEILEYLEKCTGIKYVSLSVYEADKNAYALGFRHDEESDMYFKVKVL